MLLVFNNKNFHFFSLVVLLFLATSIDAAVYYASPTGNGTGTLASPFGFPGGLGKLSNPGDTIYLRDGIYYLSAKLSINKIGSAKSRIGIIAYPGEKPILDFRSEPYGSSNPGISLSTKSSYIHLKGLVIRYAGDNGLINNGSNHIIENCEFYGNCDAGLQHKFGGNNLIINCDSHDNFDYETGGITAANFGGNADGFADKQYTGTNPNTYQGCRSWHNADDGWDFFEKIGSTFMVNCICYKNGPSTFDLSNSPRYQTDKAWFDQFPMAVTNANGGTDTITLVSYINYGNGNGFKLGGNYTSHNVTVTRCLAVGNMVKGFDQNNNYGIMTLYNNSAYQNDRNYGFSSSGGGNLIIKNCVSMNSISANSFSSKTVTNINNSWNKSGVTTDISDFVSLDTSLILTPRNSDGSYNTTFMNLVSGSDLIDAGLDVGINYANNHPDLGYFEFGIIDKFPPQVMSGQNATQTIVLGNAIVPVIFTWSGGSTGLDTAKIPKDITATFDTLNKTLTLQGTPTAIGTYQFTVTTIGGVGNPITITGNLYVSSSSAKRIAYFTTIPITAPDSLIFNKLSSDSTFMVVPVDASLTTTDYSGFDAIVMSSVPGSTSAGFPVIETVSKPKLLLKPFALKSSIWNWINTSAAINTTQTGVTISDKTHPIFSGLTFTGTNSDQLQLFSSVNSYAVTGINNSNWIANPSVNVLGNAIGTATTNSVVEVPIGTSMNGTVTTKRFIMIGLSEYSTANLTSTATELAKNSVYYLLGLESVLLPVHFTGINVVASSANSAKISWKVGIERNINKYKVQKSTNGLDFSTIADVRATRNIEYYWVDNQPFSGKNFYRIIAEEITGNTFYGPIAELTMNNIGSLTLLSNPVVDKKIRIQFNQMKEGHTVISVYNSLLQEVATTHFSYNGGVEIKTLNIPPFSATGIYFIKITLPNGQIISKTVSVK